MENHHLAAAFTTMRRPGLNFAADMPKADYDRMRKVRREQASIIYANVEGEKAEEGRDEGGVFCTQRLTALLLFFAGRH